MIRRTLIGLLLAIFVGTCFAQAGLAVKNADGQSIGWFLAKKSPAQIQMLTPRGYLVTAGVQNGDLFFNSSIDRVLYEHPCPGEICPADPCGGRAFVELSTGAEAGALRGEIVVLSGGYVLVAMPWNLAVFSPDSLTLNDQRDQFGECTSLTNPPGSSALLWAVEEINPVDLGMALVGLPEPDWRFPAPLTLAVERPAGLFCSGFESCPNQ